MTQHRQDELASARLELTESGTWRVRWISNGERQEVRAATTDEAGAVLYELDEYKLVDEDVLDPSQRLRHDRVDAKVTEALGRGMHKAATATAEQPVEHAIAAARAPNGATQRSRTNGTGVSRLQKVMQAFERWHRGY